jgi:N-acetylglutamate synthase-like GNAT family acetyltransferase
MLSYRYSHKGDENIIYSILLECFGYMKQELVTNNIGGRYLMCFDNDRLVAITGLGWSDILRCAEIDWTCVIPEYRKQGIIEDMLDKLISSTNERIVCSCWRLGTNTNVNLHKVMDKFGFKLVLKDISRSRRGYNCSRTGNYCAGCTGKDCVCSEDLYELQTR